MSDLQPDVNPALPPVTLGVVNYNGMASLPETVAALLATEYPAFTVCVADNASTDGSREWLQQAHPEVRCLALPRNLGLPGGRNAILDAADTRLVLIVDDDITVAPDTVRRLVAAMQSDDRIAACHPELVDPHDPLVYRYNGGAIHYLCALVMREKPEVGAFRPKVEQFDVVSGGALLIDRAAAQVVGNFDADYFFNWEDGDFTARLTLAGYRCVNVPDAEVRHRGKPRGASRVFHMVRNRWFFILKLYDTRTILLSLPALALFELSQAAFAILNGGLGAYLRANWAVMQTLPGTLAKRRTFQPLKVVPDSAWLHAGEIYVPAALLRSPVLSALLHLYSGVLNGYWRLIRHFC